MISAEMIRHVAELARLELTEKELKKFQKDLNEILEAFKELDRANTKNISPAFQPVEIRDVLRNDVVEAQWEQQKALSQTQHKEKGFFKGPKAV